MKGWSVQGLFRKRFTRPKKDILCNITNGIKRGRDSVRSVIHAWFLVFPVCQRALRRYSPGPVVELTSLMETPAVPKALNGFFSQ